MVHLKSTWEIKEETLFCGVELHGSHVGSKEPVRSATVMTETTILNGPITIVFCLTWIPNPTTIIPL